MATKQRHNINIELIGDNKERLEKVRRFNGMTQKELVGRLINWFCTQPRTVQQLILGQIPEEIAADVAQLILQRSAQGSAEEGKPNIADDPATCRPEPQPGKG